MSNKNKLEAAIDFINEMDNKKETLESFKENNKTVESKDDTFSFRIGFKNVGISDLEQDVINNRFKKSIDCIIDKNIKTPSYVVPNKDQIDLLNFDYSLLKYRGFLFYYTIEPLEKLSINISMSKAESYKFINDDIRGSDESFNNLKVRSAIEACKEFGKNKEDRVFSEGYTVRLVTL